jgi:diaminopimelate epimerase
MYPVFLKLSGRRVLLVGGGRVAAGKLAGLLADGAHVTVVAPEIRPELHQHGVTIAKRIKLGLPIYDENFAVSGTVTLSAGEGIDVGGEPLTVNCMSIGNPHAVQFLDTPVDDYPLERVGPAVENHSAFPARVNFGIANVLDRTHMDVRVWERGSGETLACGTGACAAVAVGRQRGLLAESVRVDLPGGTLNIRWPGMGEKLWMTGPAVTVYTGQIDI